MTLSAQRFKAVAGYLLEVIDDEVLLYHPVQETMVYCNATAAYIWSLCDGSRDLDEIARLFVACYPEASATIPQQIQAAITELLEHGVLVRVEGYSPMCSATS